MRLYLIAIAFLFLAACNQARDPKADEDAVRKQVDKYLSMLDTADPAVAKTVWVSNADVTFIHPLGHARGWSEIAKVIEFFRDNFTKRKLTGKDIRVYLHGDSAYVEFYWHFDATQNDGKVIATDGRESQMYVRQNDGSWLMVHGHYSGPAMTP